MFDNDLANPIIEALTVVDTARTSVTVSARTRSVR